MYRGVFGVKKKDNDWLDRCPGLRALGVRVVRGRILDY